MADDPKIQDGRDRSRVAGGQDYEVDYFAKKHGLSRQQAQEMIKRVGNDREKLEAEASRMRGRQQQG